MAYAAGDVNFSAISDMVTVAYSNNVAGAASTTLYAWDWQRDAFVTIGSVGGSPVSPNSGQMFTVFDPPGFFTAFSDLGFGMDISGTTGTAYFSYRTETGGFERLGTLDLATGALTVVGTFPVDILDIATAAPPTSANLRVSLSGPSIPVRSGTSVPIYLRLDNYGPDAAYPPTIEFTSSSPAGSVSITAPSGWICEGNGGETRPAVGESPSVVIAGAVFVCTANGNMPRGGTRFAFQVTAPANPPGGFITINASASSASVDPVSSNNSATFKLYVKPSETLNPVAPSIR